MLYGGRSSGNPPRNESIDRVVAPPDKQLVEWIRKALKREPRYTVSETLEGILSGKFQLLRYDNGIVVTFRTKDRLVVHLFYSDDLNVGLEQRMNDLLLLAGHFGLNVIEAYCRLGLEKPLKKLGWKREQVVMRFRGVGRKL